MDLREKVKKVLEESFTPERIELKDEDGIYGFVVSGQFRDTEMMDRQSMIYKALRHAGNGLKPKEMRRVVLIAALTPEEFMGHELSRQ